MNPKIAGIVVAAMLLSHAEWSAAQSSANYAITSSTLDSGVGDMSSANYHTSASLGQGYFAGSTTSANYTLSSGFWHALVTGSAPVLTSAVSRKVHGTAGTFDLALTLVPLGVNHLPTTESRLGPTQTIIMTFDKPIMSADPPTITERAATFGR